MLGETPIQEYDVERGRRICWVIRPFTSTMLYISFVFEVFLISSFK